MTVHAGPHPVGYNTAVTYTFGLDSSPHRTHPRFVKPDPSGGPHAS